MTRRDGAEPPVALSDTGARRCPICAGEEIQPVFSKNGYAHVRCPACRTVFVDPLPATDALFEHYQDPAYFGGDEGQGYHDYAEMRKALLPHFRRRLRTLREIISPPGQLLDIGCAAGYFLELARADGWEIAGVELAETMAGQASQALEIPIVPSLAALDDRDFDVVTFWEVLEHLPDPVFFLRDVRERLRPGGVLMLSTPNVAHWQAIAAPERWTAYQPPSHLVLFTPESLELAFRQAGLTTIQIRRVAPLPRLPAWLQSATRHLEQGLATGQARPWPVALAAWRGFRLFGLGWSRLAHPTDDNFATLEVWARRPA